MVVDVSDFESFAGDHGWDQEIAHLYFEAFSIQDADDPAEVWQRLRSSNREFELASFGLGWEVSNAALNGVSCSNTIQGWSQGNRPVRLSPSHNIFVN